ncbi:MAG: type II toxin-antitoxin system VapC family toxin [Deltaproteobacteria bacterium]|nr:type II toxin-antitoxin system VapC family toxin [Deltaproteobacteria bacterium]
MRYVLDTSALSAGMRRDEALSDFFKAHQLGDIFTAPPAVAEIHYGIERLDHSSRKYLLLKSEADRLLAIIKVLPWTSEASQHFGVIKSDLEKTGQLIDDFDIAIGAIAMAHQCTVLTANLSHFKRITNLQSIFWK